MMTTMMTMTMMMMTMTMMTMMTCSPPPPSHLALRCLSPHRHHPRCNHHDDGDDDDDVGLIVMTMPKPVKIIKVTVRTIFPIQIPY